MLTVFRSQCLMGNTCFSLLLSLMQPGQFPWPVLQGVTQGSSVSVSREATLFTSDLRTTVEEEESAPKIPQGALWPSPQVASTPSAHFPSAWTW